MPIAEIHCSSGHGVAHTFSSAIYYNELCTGDNLHPCYFIVTSCVECTQLTGAAAVVLDGIPLVVFNRRMWTTKDLQ